MGTVHTLPRLLLPATHPLPALLQVTQPPPRFDTLERHHKLREHTHLQRYVTLFYEDGSVEELVRIRKFTNHNSTEIKVSV